MLAHHFAAAAEREPAIHYLNRAAERSRELLAHRATLSLYERLLDLLTQPEDQAARFDALRDRAEVLRWIGDHEAQRVAPAPGAVRARQRGGAAATAPPLLRREARR